MRHRLLLPLALLVAPLLSCPAPRAAASDVSTARAQAKRRKPKPCPDQRYVVQGSPVLPGSTTPEAIVLSGKRVALGAACALAPARLAVTSRGTRIKARGAACAGLEGKLKLAATIDPACQVMTGTVNARRAGFKTGFTARGAICGDGATTPCAGGSCAGGAVITVDTTNDTLGDGRCSFQEAVRAANTRASVDACPPGVPGEINTIAFDVPGDGVQTIPLTSVTQITTSMAIDGSTQPGFTGTPLIHLTGTVEDLLRFSHEAWCSTLKGLMLTNTNGGGLVDGATALFYSDNNRIIGNYFNTDGVTSIGPFGAGLLFDHSINNVIGGTTAERNVFGGQTGIFLQDSSRNLIDGNYFGVRPDGNTLMTDLPANGNGIQIFDVTGSAAGNTIRGNVVAGYLAGVNMFQGATANALHGNHVGVGADGVTALGNGIGVFLYGASGNAIGGTTPGDRNVISGNESTNIRVQDYEQYRADDNVIEGNSIGPDATGQRAVSPNALFGVYVVGGSGNLIRKNVIAGNQQGVYIDETSTIASGSSENCIAGNATYGVHNANAAGAPFADNWWGDSSGPRYSGHAVGAGDWVSSNVTFVPFLPSRPAACSP